jgi:hypothetical protein
MQTKNKKLSKVKKDQDSFFTDKLSMTNIKKEKSSNSTNMWPKINYSTINNSSMIKDYYYFCNPLAMILKRL